MRRSTWSRTCFAVLGDDERLDAAVVLGGAALDEAHRLEPVDDAGDVGVVALSAWAIALIVIGSPGRSCISAIDCIGASPSSFSVAMRRGLSALKMRQNSAHASRAAVLDTVDVDIP